MLNFKTSMTFKVAASFCALLTLPFTTSNTSDRVNFHYLPGLPDDSYSKLGDINIGGLVAIWESASISPAESCSKEFHKSYSINVIEPTVFAVDYINRNSNILPNISLGFVISGICPSYGVAVGNSLSFLHRTKGICENSTCTIQAVSSSDSTWLSHDVIGVVGPGWSKLTVPISYVYAVGHQPMVGTTETSDELSNKNNHPYFFRVAPPDVYQVKAMLKFISANAWSYISIVYVEGSYGEKAFNNFQRNVGRYGICIATSHKLGHQRNYKLIASDLVHNKRARVVVLFMGSDTFKEILQAVHDVNAASHFIWIGSDALGSYHGFQYKGADYDLGIGTITFDLQVSYVPEYFDHLKKLRVTTTKNPWFKRVWEYLFDCSYDEGACDPDMDIFQSPKYEGSTYTSLRIDAVLTLAQAAHDLLSARCPNARAKEARSCITGELLREYLKNTSFQGFSDLVKFDENQDKRGNYIIKQYVHDYIKNPFSGNISTTSKKGVSKKQIAIYQTLTDTLNLTDESISWSHILDNPFELTPNQAPQSVCSIPCRVGEYKIEKEVPCCWECRKCRDNERLVKDNTTCEPCPSFMWPDAASGFTVCMDIPLTYPKFQDPIPVVFTSIAIFALIVNVFIIACFIIYRNEKAIKASSRELSFMQLFAIFIGYTSIILFQIKPSDTMCGAIFFLFCSSFSLLYAPLLVKTLRICRIFRSSKKNQRPRFISQTSQLIFTSFLIMIQVVLCITVYILYWPRVRRIQPIWTEKLVELSCDLTFPGIASFLGYNIVLVFLCSVFAFMVRKLPNNFNESKFISMCVSTTLLIWLAFTPAYFTANRAFVRVFLLSVGLFLNHSVALMLLFVPKIYAAKFLPPEAGQFSSHRG